MPKEPTLTETIQALRDAKASLELIGSNIQALLERYDNVNLPAKILKEAKRSRVARIRTAWLQTQFGFGYVRAAKLIELMQTLHLIESSKTKNVSGYRILKPPKQVAPK